ncbi:MAG TPA: 30S ribosome-binding factor RbfA [Candidatus Binatia bacterium]|jgi:ribosome-binding factor A
MEFQRSDRVADLLREILAELLHREIRDPRLQTVNMTGVKVTHDLRHATVFFSVLGDSVGKREALAGLKSAAGFIRSKVAKQLKLRFVPSIEFVYDETEEKAQRIESLLRDVKS